MKLRKKSKKRNIFRRKDSVMIMVEKQDRCKAYPDIRFMLSISEISKVMEITAFVRDRIIAIDEKKYRNQSIFIYADKIQLHQGNWYNAYRKIN